MLCQDSPLVPSLPPPPPLLQKREWIYLTISTSGGVGGGGGRGGGRVGGGGLVLMEKKGWMPTSCLLLQLPTLPVYIYYGAMLLHPAGVRHVMFEMKRKLAKQPPTLSGQLLRAVMNQWTVPLEWNGGMEYWNT